MVRLNMKKCHTILIDTTKIALLPGKIDQYEFLTGKEVLPSK